MTRSGRNFISRENRKRERRVTAVADSIAPRNPGEDVARRYMQVAAGRSVSHQRLKVINSRSSQNKLLNFFHPRVYTRMYENKNDRLCERNPFETNASLMS